MKSNATFDYTKNHAFDDLMDVLRDDQGFYCFQQKITNIIYSIF